MKKGDYVSIIGPFKVFPKQNPNGFAKFTIKVSPTKTEVERRRIIIVERELNNTADMRLLLLKYAYTSLKNEEKVSCDLTADEIVKEMKAMVIDACKHMC